MNDVTENNGEGARLSDILGTRTNPRPSVYGVRPAETTERLRIAHISLPPHAPEVEEAFSKEMEALVAKGDAFAKERLKQAFEKLSTLEKHLSLVSRRALLVLKAHHETVTVIRKQAEEVGRVCDELTAGHDKVLEMLNKPL